MSNLKIKGDWFVSLYGEDKETPKQRIAGQNIITTAGVSALVQHLVTANAAASTFTFAYIAVGTDATGETSADTALGVESARTTGVVSQLDGGIYQVTATFPSGTATTAIVEYGLFDSSAAGTMFSRDTEAVVNKGANDDLTVITQITFT